MVALFEGAELGRRVVRYLDLLGSVETVQLAGFVRVAAAATGAAGAHINLLL